MGTVIRSGFILRDGTDLSVFEWHGRVPGKSRGPARVIPLFPASALEKYPEQLAKRTGAMDAEAIRRPSRWWQAALVQAERCGAVFFRSIRRGLGVDPSDLLSGR